MPAPDPVRFRMAEMTPEEAGAFIRNIAELTAANSQNWDNFEQIVVGMINSAMDAARSFGQKEAKPDPPPAEGR